MVSSVLCCANSLVDREDDASAATSIGRLDCLAILGSIACAVYV